MSVIWHKIWFDLWGNKVWKTPAALTISAGVFAISALSEYYAAQDAGLQVLHLWFKPQSASGPMTK